MARRALLGRATRVERAFGTTIFATSTTLPVAAGAQALQGPMVWVPGLMHKLVPVAADQLGQTALPMQAVAVAVALVALAATTSLSSEAMAALAVEGQEALCSEMSPQRLQ